MIKVTFEFLNVDAAIVALGKLSSVASAKLERTDKAPPTALPVATEPNKGGRKPRNDAGKPRGPRKNAADGNSQPPQEAGAPAPTTPTVATETAAPEQREPASPVTAASKAGEKPANSTATPGGEPPAAAAPKQEDAEAALALVFEAHGLPKAQEVLQRFGVTRLRDLLPAQRADFIQFAGETAAAKPAAK